MLQVSGGCEPQFAIEFYRKTESLHKNEKEYKVECNEVSNYRKINNLSKTDKLPDFFITSTEIALIDRIKSQSIMQNHVDASISLTVNLAKNVSIDDVEQLYLKAWEYGLKGITIYREGCKREGILTNGEKSYKYDYIIPRSRTDIGKTYGTTQKLTTACGSLFLTINKDIDGNIVETFTNTSKTGVCKSNIDGLNRLISLSLRSGVKIDEIIDQLGGINCSACVRVKAKGDKKLDGISCPDIISKALMDEYKNTKNNIINIDNNQKCPDCNNILTHESGCTVCTNCGYSSCG
jgi:ribonucleoside-diphosphate reductase alpha chain